MSLREAYRKRGEVYMERYYRQLEGAKIVQFLGIEEDDFGGEGFPKFHIQFPNGENHEVVVSQDPEGNGGGFLFLPYEPAMDSYDKEHKLNNYEVKA